MHKGKRLALLSLLLLMSVASAVAASASGTLLILAGKGDVKIDADEVLMYTKLSPEQREKAIEIALGDPRVQEMLEGVDDYRTSVSEILDIQETEGGIALIPKEGLALVELRIYKDYGEELGFKVAKVTVDLLEEEVKEIEEGTEVRKPKVHEGIVSTDELLGNPSKYHDQVVTVSGEVSKLGEVRGPYFMLDEKIWVCYLHEEASVDISNVTNGDYVTVTGRFWAEDTVYAQKIEKGTIILPEGEGGTDILIPPEEGRARVLNDTKKETQHSTNDDEIAVSNITIVKQAELTEEEEAKALEIALDDPRVQEIIEGKEYEITGVGAITEIPSGRKAGATVAIFIPEEAVYSLMIDLEKEEVIDIVSFQPKEADGILEIPEE